MQTRKQSDRWHRLNDAVGDLDTYVTTRRAAKISWHGIALALAQDTADHPDVRPPTVATLTRWYADQTVGTPA